MAYWARKAVVNRRHSLVRLPGAGRARLGWRSLLDLLTVVTNGTWPLQVVCNSEAVAIVSLGALEALLRNRLAFLRLVVALSAGSRLSRRGATVVTHRADARD